MSGHGPANIGIYVKQKQQKQQKLVDEARKKVEEYRKKVEEENGRPSEQDYFMEAPYVTEAKKNIQLSEINDAKEKAKQGCHTPGCITMGGKYKTKRKKPKRTKKRTNKKSKKSKRYYKK